MSFTHPSIHFNFFVYTVTNDSICRLETDLLLTARLNQTSQNVELCFNHFTQLLARTCISKYATFFTWTV